MRAYIYIYIYAVVGYSWNTITDNSVSFFLHEPRERFE